MEQVSNSAFSIRRLNPFNGLLQVFLLGTARALSADGRTWEIQVLSDTPQGLWANTPFSGRQYYTFGRWSAEQGLEQVPVNPLFNIRQMIASAEQLLERLEPACEQLPFPLSDPYELWLLDGANQEPIALLASCRSQEECDGFSPDEWKAAAADETSFQSATLSQQNPSFKQTENPRHHASVVEQAVIQRAGAEKTCRWFLRKADNSATSCDDSGQTWPAECFPELLVTETWRDQLERELIQDYLNWKAPQLLMLPGIREKTRERLERQAVKQAEAVDRLWRLYPQIHNHDLLKSARVEARIRSANKH